MPIEIKNKILVFSLIILLQNGYIDAMKKNIREDHQMIQTNFVNVLPYELICTILSISNLKALKCFMLLDSDSYKKTTTFLEKYSRGACFNHELKRYVTKKAVEQNSLNIGHSFFKTKAEEILYRLSRSPFHITQETFRLLSNKNVENFEKYNDEENNDLNASLDKFLSFNDLKKATCRVDQIGIFRHFPRANLHPMFIISTIKYNNNNNSINVIGCKDMKINKDLEKFEDNCFPGISSLDNLTLFIDNSASSIFEIFKDKQLLEKVCNLYFGGRNQNFKTSTLFQEYPLINLKNLILENMNGIPDLRNINNLKNLTLKNNNLDVDNIKIRLPKNLKTISIKNCKITNFVELLKNIKTVNENIEINILNPQPLTKSAKLIK